MADADLIGRLFDVIENDIVPLTVAGVAKGNKLFGAAILRKGDRSLVLAETNNEMENPLWHGVLTPIGEEQDFLIVDRGGDGSNLEECHFSHPYEIHLPDGK